MSLGRLARNKRSGSPPPMQLTDRDLRILRLVADFRHMTREQVEKLEFTPSTASYCKRRLMLLYQHGHLERRFLPLRAAFGAARAYYALDTRGADLLAEVMELPRRQLDWRPRDGRREPLFMEHALRVNDVRVIAMLAARRVALEPAWIDERDLKRRMPDLRVRDPLFPRSTITVIPDGYFSLGTRHFALELDRGTVEEGPFKRKVRGYGAWKSSGIHAKAFGTPSLRVLWVVADARRDPHRLQRIKRWTEAANGATMFWFAELTNLSPESFLTKPVWAVARRDELYPLFSDGGLSGLADSRRND